MIMCVHTYRCSREREREREGDIPMSHMTGREAEVHPRAQLQWARRGFWRPLVRGTRGGAHILLLPRYAAWQVWLRLALCCCQSDLNAQLVSECGPYDYALAVALHHVEHLSVQNHAAKCMRPNVKIINWYVLCLRAWYGKLQYGVMRCGIICIVLGIACTMHA